MNSTTTYNEQARKFLADTATKFEQSFLKHGKHFPDDKQARNFYQIILTRNGDYYTFKFGQSLANTKKRIPPTAYDVLACLTKDDPGSFEEFCSNYGYDNDSRTAEKIYKAVVEEWEGVNRLFSDVLDELREIN